MVAVPGGGREGGNRWLDVGSVSEVALPEFTGGLVVRARESIVEDGPEIRQTALVGGTGFETKADMDVYRTETLLTWIG